MHGKTVQLNTLEGQPLGRTADAERQVYWALVYTEVYRKTV